MVVEVSVGSCLISSGYSRCKGRFSVRVDLPFLLISFTVKNRVLHYTLCVVLPLHPHLKGCSISPRGALSNPTRGTDTPTPREWSTKHPWVFHNPSTVFNVIVQKVEQ